MSVSLSDNDVAFIDRYCKEHQVGSRSEVIRRALYLLYEDELEDEHEAEDPDEGKPDYYDLNPNWADKYPLLPWAEDEDE